MRKCAQDIPGMVKNHGLTRRYIVAYGDYTSTNTYSISVTVDGGGFWKPVLKQLLNL